MADERIQDLIDLAITGEPASFKATLDAVLLDKISGMVDQVRDDMSNSTLQPRGTEDDS